MVWVFDVSYSEADLTRTFTKQTVVRASNRDALTTRHSRSGSSTDRNRQQSFLGLGNNIPKFFTELRISQIREKRRKGRHGRDRTRSEEERKRKRGAAEALHHGELKMMIGGKRGCQR